MRIRFRKKWDLGRAKIWGFAIGTLALIGNMVSPTFHQPVGAAEQGRFIGSIISDWLLLPLIFWALAKLHNRYASGR